MTTGELFESRVARLLTLEGNFVRRRVDLGTHFRPERMQITDLDLLVFAFGADLALTRTIGECKSGDSRGGPKEIDQLIRLVGLRQIVSSNRAMLATVRAASDRVRAVGRQLRVSVVDANDITRREARVALDGDSLWGSHHPRLVEREPALTRIAKRDRELERSYWLLRSEVWLLDPILGLKRTMSVLDTLSKKWIEGLPGEERDCLAWLLIDAIVAFSTMALVVAADAVFGDREEFRRQTTERLSEGIASFQQLQRLSKVVDKYVASILEQEGVSRTKQIAALGALAPSPPAYAESLLEVLERLADRPRDSRSVPQVLDVILSGVIRLEEGSPFSIRPLQVDQPEATVSQARLILRYLEGQAGLPAEFNEALRPFRDTDDAKVTTAPHAGKEDVTTQMNQDSGDSNSAEVVPVQQLPIDIPNASTQGRRKRRESP